MLLYAVLLATLVALVAAYDAASRTELARQLERLVNCDGPVYVRKCATWGDTNEGEHAATQSRAGATAV